MNLNRQFSRMLEILKLLDDRFSLDMYLMGHHLRAKKEIQSLKKLATQDWRIRICDPIEFIQAQLARPCSDLAWATVFGIIFDQPVNSRIKVAQNRLQVKI